MQISSVFKFLSPFQVFFAMLTKPEYLYTSVIFTIHNLILTKCLDYFEFNSLLLVSDYNKSYPLSFPSNL